MHKVIATKIDPNENFVTLTELFRKEGESVAKGDLLFTVESTKANLDVVAESSGNLFFLKSEGDKIDVGEIIAIITPEKSIDKSAFAEAKKQVESGSQWNASRKAIALAEQHGLDLSQIRKRGAIKEQDVRDYLEQQASHATSQPSEATLEKPKIVLLGAGGQACDLVETIRLGHAFDIAGFIDSGFPGRKEYLGYPILGDESSLSTLRDQGIEFFTICYGWVKDCQKREETTHRCYAHHLQMPVLIHPSASIFSTARLGAGSIVLANATVGADAILKTGVCINNNAVVSHGTVVDDFSTVSPGAMVASNVRIGKRCVIGMNTSIYSEITIRDDSIVFNNTSVNKDIV